VFNQVVLLLSEQGVLSLKELTLDGTKIEANANRYTFVWGKAIRSSRERIAKQLKELWSYVDEVYQDEEQQPREPDMETIDPAAVTRTINEINDALKDKEIDPKVKQKLAYAKKNWPGKLQEYENKEKLLAGRNSYSKTDPDATFMRMKEDHMRNGQLKPAYNVQASTTGHYILNYTLGQKTNDTTELKGHIDDYIESYDQKPESLTADAGYGSEENYDFLEEKGITPYVKYNWFDKERRDKKHAANPFNPDNLFYNEQRDTYYCPIGQPMAYIGDKQRKTASGLIRNVRLYQARNCDGCPMRSACHRSDHNRIIERNPNLNRHRKKIKQLLESDEGIEKRRQRWKVEAVFGNIKQNKGFRRFALRGIEKVSTELGLIAIAHNLQRFSLNPVG